MRWFKRTHKNYTDDQMIRDHEDTVQEIFGLNAQIVGLEEQIAEAEAGMDETLLEDEN